MKCYLFDAPTYFAYLPDVPELLYYTHVPAILISLILGVFVFFAGRGKLLNSLLLLVVLSFSAWVMNDLVGWTNNNADLLAFLWPLYAISSSMLAVMSVYLATVFTRGSDVPLSHKLAYIALLSPVFLFASSNFNISGFNLTECDAYDFEGMLYKGYSAFIGFVSVVWIAIHIIRNYRKVEDNMRRELLVFGFGIESFLLLFVAITFTVGYLANLGILGDSQLEWYGLFGVVLFVLMLTVLIVRYQAFSVKLIATQALAYAIAILTGAEIFAVEKFGAKLVVIATFVLAVFGGWALVRSVKKEVALREEVEQLAGRLKSVNRIMSHDVKSVLNKNKMLMGALLDGSFGEVPDGAKTLISKAEHETGNMLEAVMTILQSGQELVLHKESFDVKKEVIDVVETLTPDARAKGLSLHLDLDYGASVVVNADPLFMRVHVLKNLILNSILYTPSGSVTVKLEHIPGEKVLFSVKDTGVGIAQEDAPLLFREGGHGAHSQEVNTHSTGYGLFSAKRIVDAHGGRIWFESEGAGKGSTFFVELPIG